MSRNNIHILMGLPGSGKTYFAKNWIKLSDSENSYTIIDLDNHIIDNPNLESVISCEITEKLKYVSWYQNFNCCIDGLILTKDNLKCVIQSCYDNIKSKRNHKFINIIVHIWDDDRQKCVKNDNVRIKMGVREKSSRITIQNSPFDRLSKEDIIDIVNIIDKNIHVKVKHHTIYKMSDYDGFIDKWCPSHITNNEPEFLYSEYWCGGGTWGNCWGDSGTVSSDPTPEFKYFDDMLTEICPSISFMQYKKLYNECVSIHSEHESDYYGGSTINYCYKLDLKQMYNMLNEMGLI